MNRKVNILVVILILAALTVGVVWYANRLANQSQKAADLAQKAAEEQQKNIKVPRATIDTTNWKTYRNNLYGYSIKYPANWEIIREDKKWETEFSPIGESYYLEGDPAIGIIRIGASPDVKFDKSTYSDLQKIAIDGREAYENKNGFQGEVSIYFQIGAIPLGLINDVSPAVLNSEHSDKAGEYNKIFEAMVSTFRFTK